MDMVKAPGTSLLTSFMAAFSAPIVKPIVWPDKIQANHPLRSLNLFVRYWPASIQALVSASDKPQGWLSDIYHAIIAASVCNADGVAIFDEQWPTVWSEYVDLFNKAIFAEEDGNALLTGKKTLLQEFTRDENNNPVSPLIDYKILGDWLKKNHDNQQSWELFEILFEQAFVYNGYTADSAKNSETTNTSEPSTVPQ